MKFIFIHLIKPLRSCIKLTTLQALYHCNGTCILLLPLCVLRTHSIRTCIRDLMASSGKETIHRAQPPRPPDMNVLKESVQLGSELLITKSNTVTFACISFSIEKVSKCIVHHKILLTMKKEAVSWQKYVDDKIFGQRPL